MNDKPDWCPCGNVILVDTEDWEVPLCHDCFEELNKTKGEK